MKLPAKLAALPVKVGGTYLVVSSHYWGRGTDLAAAVKECRKAGASFADMRSKVAVLWGEGDCKPYVDPLGRVFANVKLETLLRKGF